MYRIIDGRGTGKTSRLMLLAKEQNAIIACSNPDAMKAKAEAYGFTDLNFISYFEYIKHKYPTNRKIFIDELEVFVASFGGQLDGYSLSNED